MHLTCGNKRNTVRDLRFVAVGLWTCTAARPLHEVIKHEARADGRSIMTIFHAMDNFSTQEAEAALPTPLAQSTRVETLAREGIKAAEAAEARKGVASPAPILPESTPFQKKWKEALEQNSTQLDKLCNADKLASIKCPGEEDGMNYSSNCAEFCKKLAGVMKDRQNVVGTFPRCAARLDEKAAKEFADPNLPNDYGCLVTPFSQSGFFKYWEMYQKGDVILILGQGLNPDGTAPLTLKRRAEKAAELFHKHQIPVIVSGGDDRATGKTEAMPMAEVMYQLGVPYEAILYEGQATTSLENFWFGFRLIRRLMHPKDKVNIKLVTSDWHMPRAAYMGKVVAHYFKNADNRPHVPSFFQKLDVQIEEVPVKSYCSQDPNATKGDFVGSNTQNFARKCNDEANILKKHINGHERMSVGADSVDSNVWGVLLDPVLNILESHQNRINALLKWSQANNCSGLPDIEAVKMTPDELLKSNESNETAKESAASRMMKASKFQMLFLAFGALSIPWFA